MGIVKRWLNNALWLEGLQLESLPHGPYQPKLYFRCRPAENPSYSRKYVLQMAAGVSLYEQLLYRVLCSQSDMVAIAWEALQIFSSSRFSRLALKDKPGLFAGNIDTMFGNFELGTK